MKNDSNDSMNRHELVTKLVGAATGGSLTTEALARVLEAARREVAEAEAEASVDWARARVAPRNAGLEQTAGRLARARVATLPDGGTAATAGTFCTCTTAFDECAYCAVRTRAR